MASVLERAQHFLEEPAFKTGKAATHVIGKAGIKTLAELAAPVLIPGAIAEGASRAALFAAPLAAALSSGLVVMDYLHEKDKLLDQYRPQIARWKSQQTGQIISPQQVTEADFNKAIETIPVLGETVDQAKKERNWGIGISAISSILSTVVVGCEHLGVLGENPIHHFLHSGMLEGHDWTTIGARALVGGLIGFAMYLPISAGLHWLAETMFGLEKETANDHIREIKRERARGHEISQEQVLDAFVKATPSLDHEIKSNFGKRFHKLSAEQRQLVVEMVGPQMGLVQMTQAINNGLPPEELAFAVDNAAAGKMHARKAEDALNPIYASVGLEAEEQPRKSFVERFAKNQAPDADRSFVQAVGRREGIGSFTDAVDQSRANPEVQIG